jgi:hypothetical protein
MKKATARGSTLSRRTRLLTHHILYFTQALTSEVSTRYLTHHIYSRLQQNFALCFLYPEPSLSFSLATLHHNSKISHYIFIPFHSLLSFALSTTKKRYEEAQYGPQFHSTTIAYTFLQIQLQLQFQHLNRDSVSPQSQTQSNCSHID